MAGVAGTGGALTTGGLIFNGTAPLTYTFEGFIANADADAAANLIRYQPPVTAPVTPRRVLPRVGNINGGFGFTVTDGIQFDVTGRTVESVGMPGWVNNANNYRTAGGPPDSQVNTFIDIRNGGAWHALGAPPVLPAALNGIPFKGDSSSVILIDLATGAGTTYLWTPSQEELELLGSTIIVDGLTNIDSHLTHHPQATIENLNLIFGNDWAAPQAPAGLGLPPIPAISPAVASVMPETNIVSLRNPRAWFFSWANRTTTLSGGGQNPQFAFYEDYSFNVHLGNDTITANADYVQDAKIRINFRRNQVATDYYLGVDGRTGTPTLRGTRVWINPTTRIGDGGVALDTPVSINDIWYGPSNANVTGVNNADTPASEDRIVSRYARRFVTGAGTGITAVRFSVASTDTTTSPSANIGEFNATLKSYGVTDTDGNIDIGAPATGRTTAETNVLDTDRNSMASITIQNTANRAAGDSAYATGTDQFFHRLYLPNTKLITTLSTANFIGRFGANATDPDGSARDAADATSTDVDDLLLDTGFSGSYVDLSLQETIRVPGFVFRTAGLTLPGDITGSMVLDVDPKYSAAAATAATGATWNAAGRVLTLTSDNVADGIYSLAVQRHYERENVNAQSVLPFTPTSSQRLELNNNFSITGTGNVTLSDGQVTGIQSVADIDWFDRVAFSGMDITGTLTSPRSFTDVPDDLTTDFTVSGSTTDFNIVSEGGRVVVLENCSGNVTVTRAATSLTGTVQVLVSNSPDLTVDVTDANVELIISTTFTGLGGASGNGARLQVFLAPSGNVAAGTNALARSAFEVDSISFTNATGLTQDATYRWVYTRPGFGHQTGTFVATGVQEIDITPLETTSAGDVTDNSLLANIDVTFESGLIVYEIQNYTTAPGAGGGDVNILFELAKTNPGFGEGVAKIAGLRTAQAIRHTSTVSTSLLDGTYRIDSDTAGNQQYLNGVLNVGGTSTLVTSIGRFTGPDSLDVPQVVIGSSDGITFSDLEAALTIQNTEMWEEGEARGYLENGDTPARAGVIIGTTFAR